MAVDPMVVGILPSGWRLLPIGPDKRPRLRDWPNRAMPASEKGLIQYWLDRWPDAGLAVVTGPESGVLVLDVDTEEGHGVDGFSALDSLMDELGFIPLLGPVTRTPTGGHHFFFAWPPGVPEIPSRPIAPGLDVKGTRGYVVLPTGDRTPGRRWEQGPDRPLALLSARWHARLLPLPRTPLSPPPIGNPSGRNERYIEAALASACERIATAPVGTRHNTTFREAASLARLEAQGLDLAEAEVGLTAAARTSGLPEAEARRTVRDALHRGAGRRP